MGSDNHRDLDTLEGALMNGTTSKTRDSRGSVHRHDRRRGRDRKPDPRSRSLRAGYVEDYLGGGLSDAEGHRGTGRRDGAGVRTAKPSTSGGATQSMNLTRNELVMLGICVGTGAIAGISWALAILQGGGV